MRPGSGQRATETRLNPARAPGRGAARPEPLSPAGPPQAPASCPARPPARLPEPGSAVTWALRGHRPGLGSRRGRPALSPRPLPCISRTVPVGLGRRSLRPPAFEVRPSGAGPALPPLSPGLCAGPEPRR